jgi:hypothetical protein
VSIATDKSPHQTSNTPSMSFNLPFNIYTKQHVFRSKHTLSNSSFKAQFPYRCNTKHKQIYMYHEIFDRYRWNLLHVSFKKKKNCTNNEYFRRGSLMVLSSWFIHYLPCGLTIQNINHILKCFYCPIVRDSHTTRFNSVD